MNCESEDEVLEEVDVYLNRSIQPNIDIFEYRSKKSPIAEQTDIEVKARPNHKIFELNAKIDTKSENFDQKKSELFGRYLDSNELRTDPKKCSKELTNCRLERQVLQSMEIKPALSQYCLAVVRNDCPELHLNPIESIIHFKPKLNYLNNKFSDNREGFKTKSASKGDESSDESEPQPMDVQTITMRFAGPDEDRQRKARERSFAYYQQQLAKDDWIPIKYHSIDSQLSSDNRMALIYNSSQTTANYRKTNEENNSICSLNQFLSTLSQS